MPAIKGKKALKRNRAWTGMIREAMADGGWHEKMAIVYGLQHRVPATIAYRTAIGKKFRFASHARMVVAGQRSIMLNTWGSMQRVGEIETKELDGIIYGRLSEI